MRKSAPLIWLFCFAQLLFGFEAAAQDTVKIGLIYVFSGRLAHYGAGGKQGAELAIQEINDSGGILGKKIVSVYGDTKLKPDVGVEVATKLINDEKIDVLMGVVSSAVADAIAPLANKMRTPFIDTLAMTPDVTGSKCNPYTFRISMNGPQNIMGAAAIAAESEANYWTTIGPDYLFGYQCWEYFQKYLRDKKKNVTFAPDSEIAYTPIDAADFGPAINKIMNTRADGVLVSLYAGNLVDFIKQANTKGLFDGKRKVLLNLAYSADVMFGMGLDMPKGVWLSGLYWFLANNSPANKSFVDAYLKKYKVFPDFNAHGGYAGVKVYAAAVQKAGSLDKEKIIKALEDLTIDLPVGTVIIRKEDHQAVQDCVWGMTAEYDGKMRFRALKPLRIFPGNEVTPPVEQTGCNMRR